MKEEMFKSRRFEEVELLVQIFNGNELGMFGENKGHFFTDNEEFAYEMLKLLKIADEKGCFDKYKKNGTEFIKEVFV